MKQYLDLLTDVLENGTYKEKSRNGMPSTISVFGRQFRHDLSKGFPLYTTKKVSWKSIVIELAWFLSGDTNVLYLNRGNVKIWNDDSYNYYIKFYNKVKRSIEDHNKGFWNHEEKRPFTKEEYSKKLAEIATGDEIDTKYAFNLYGEWVYYRIGDCGKQYGWLWRRLDDHIDQIHGLYWGLKVSPFSRRHVLSAWNVPTLDDMALPACHSLVQWNVRVKNDVKILDCNFYMRSNDLFLGNPYNVASYALLTHLFAHGLGYQVGEIICSIGDAHLYDNHIEQAKLQITREPLQLPTLNIPEDFDVENYLFGQGIATDPGQISTLIHSLENYKAYDRIKAELSTGEEIISK